MYYIYQHIRKDKNEVFYIGVGTKPKIYTSYKIEYKRAYSKQARNKYWNNITDKTSYKIEILEHFSTYEDALKEEIRLIKLYGRKNDGGILCNMTLGGEGFSCAHSEEANRKLRIANLGLKCNFTKKQLKNLSKLAKDKFSKKIFQYDLEGNYIKKWGSIRKAAKVLSIQESGISATASKESRQRSCGGFLWSYVKYKTLLPYVRKQHIPVNQYTKEGKFIKSYLSAQRAAREIGRRQTYSYVMILKCCKGKIKSAYKYIWKFPNKGLFLQKYEI